MTGALVLAAGLGFAKKQGYTIPHVEVVGEAGTVAIGGYLIQKFGIYRAPWLSHLVTAAGVIAVYDMVSTGNIPLMHSAAPKEPKVKGTEFEGIDGGYNVE